MGVRGGSRWALFTLVVGVWASPPTCFAQAAPSALRTDTIVSDQGEVLITPILHASVQIEHAGTIIHVDPWSRGDYSSAKPANLILVTDVPGDHLDSAAIAALGGPGVPIIVPPSARDSVPNAEVLANGERTTVLGILVEAVASYDLTPGEPYHPPGRGNGYVVTLGGTRLYFSGGGLECVPEIEALTEIDIAFIAMNLPQQRMTPWAAAECVRAFGPRIVYPYHFRDADLDVFEDGLRDLPIEVRRGDWYPSGMEVPF